MIRHQGQTISLENVSELVGLAYARAFSHSNITKGFFTTGIYPFNPHLFGELEFAGAEVTNRTYIAEAEITEVELERLNIDVASQPGTSDQESQDLLLTKSKMPLYSVRPGTSKASDLIKSPEEIRPFPKALPRKKKGRKNLGKTRILTDTHTLGSY